MTHYGQNEHFHLSDLLYYDPAQKIHADLQKGLKEYRFLLQASSLAVQSLLDGHLEKFDSLVGENACQIRAIKIALIASKDTTNFQRLNQKIAAAQALVESLLMPESISTLMREGRSLKEMIDQHQLDIDLTSDEIFAIKSHILYEMIDSTAEGEFMPTLFKGRKIMPNKLKTLNSDISSYFLTRLASKLRRLISDSSVSFVKKMYLFRGYSKFFR